MCNLVCVLLLLFSFPYSYSQWINSPSLDCSRIPTTLCCTSRVREQCAAQCRNVDCGSNQFASLFSTDFTAGGTAVSARDGSAHVNANDNNGEIPDSLPQLPAQGFIPPDQQPISGSANGLTPPPPAPPTGAPQIFTTQIASNLNPAYPTLIPFEPSIDESTANWSKQGETAGAAWTTVKPPVEVQTAHRRKTPDPRIIRPPAELVMIDEYDLDKTEPEFRESPSVVSNTGFVMGASSSDLRSASSEPFRHDGVSTPFHSTASRSVDTNAAVSSSEKRPTWSVSLLRRSDADKDLGSTDSRIPNFAVDGQAGNTGTRGQSAIHRGIDALIDGLSSQTGANMRERSKSVEYQKNLRNGFGELEAVMGSGSVFRTTTIGPLPITLPRTPSLFSTALPMLPFRPQPAPAFPQCGVAPEYTPCVSSHIASKDLMACCQKKNLTPGCLQLCRYDITQAEVRAAMDRGQCGLLSVAPFLECASQGHDNTKCCQDKAVGTKTGPQCLQFCRSGMGLTPLGLQHIVCGNAIGEMLQCHHAGIRPKLF